MSNRVAAIGIAVIIIGFLVIRTCVLVVNEFDQVVLTEFGQPVGEARTEPGLYFVMPWYQPHRYSKRLLRWDGERAQIPTADKRFIWVDTTARWRVKDPLKFLQSVRNYRGAQTRLDDIIDSEVRTVLSENDLIEAVRTDPQLVRAPGEATKVAADLHIERGRKVLQDRIVERAQITTLEQFGIELKDVRIKRINYIEEVQASIFNRMIAERKKVAEEYRSVGKGKAAEILGRMEKQLKVIRSGAYRKAREIEGEADAEATRIYAEAYSQDSEFYAFLQTLETYSGALGKARKKGTRTTLLMSTGAEFFKYLKTADAKAKPAPFSGPVIQPTVKVPELSLGVAPDAAVDPAAAAAGADPTAPPPDAPPPTAPPAAAEAPAEAP